MALAHLPQPAMPALNTTTVILAVLVATTLYGLLAGKQRLRIFILSIYVGIVLAEQFASVLAPTLRMLGPDQISWLLLGAPIVIFGFFGIVHAKHHAKGSAIANLIVGLLAGCLIISSAIQLLPPSEMTGVNNSSFLALNLQQYHLIFLGGLPVVVLLLGFFARGEHHGGH
jgi:hypothetical protein